MSAVHKHSSKQHNSSLNDCSECHFWVRTTAACALVLGVIFSSGCATTGESGSAAAMSTMLQQAHELNASGSRDKALALLDQAAKENPTSKEPWLRIAQLHFDASNYPLAMQAAQEVLAREPLNQEAKSVLIVSGLRVAARAISELRNENALSGSTRSEAEKLARSLRETLGESVLVPAPAPVVDRAGAREPASKTRTAKPVARPTRNTKPKATTTGGAASPASSSDPFGALR